MTISSEADLAGLQRVGRLVARTIAHMRDQLRPGITTAELDDAAQRFAGAEGARSAPQLTYDFPGFTCISVNEEIVHGVPGPRVLRPRDVVKIDVTAELDGYVADSAVTVILPPATGRARRLRECARLAFARALGAARAGNRVSEIGRAVEQEVRRHGFSVLRDLTGHGVGRTIHESPAVPNYYSPFVPGVLTDGMVIAVEPLLSAEPAEVVEEADGWTLRTDNRCLAVHHEHTIVVTKGAPIILTAA